MREGGANVGINVDNDYPEEDVEKYRNAVDPSYANTDWYDVIFKDATPMVQHNLSLRGGTENVKYFTSFWSSRSTRRVSFRRFRLSTL